MKKYGYIILICFLAFACGKKAPSSAQPDVFHVSGNCGMCKKTIEKSLNVNGVFSADWNKQTKDITVVYDSKIISLDIIKQRIAKAGYDNDTYKAADEDYNGLHSCCQYDRGK